MAIRAVFFDIDNTFYNTEKFAERARRNAINGMREAGLGATEKEAYAALLKVIARRTSNYDGHFNEALELLGVKPAPRLIAAGIAAYHNTKASIIPFPEVKRTLIALREQGYKLYAASEGESLKQWDKLIRLGLDPFFHDVFVTEDVGTKKSKAFYSKILAKLKLTPAETVMVGDSVEKDILPAKQAGMRAILVLHGKKKAGNADIVLEDLNGLEDAIKSL